MAQASTMVSSSAPSVYSVQALVLLAEVSIFFRFCLWQMNVCVHHRYCLSHIYLTV